MQTIKCHNCYFGTFETKVRQCKMHLELGKDGEASPTLQLAHGSTIDARICNYFLLSEMHNLHNESVLDMLSCPENIFCQKDPTFIKPGSYFQYSGYA